MSIVQFFLVLMIPLGLFGGMLLSWVLRDDKLIRKLTLIGVVSLIVSISSSLLIASSSECSTFDVLFLFDTCCKIFLLSRLQFISTFAVVLLGSALLVCLMIRNKRKKMGYLNKTMLMPLLGLSFRCVPLISAMA
jgi:hypothetical protein